MIKTGYHLHREKPWRCVGCGHRMNAATGQRRNDPMPPKEGDLTVCINCSMPYKRSNNRWQEMQPEDWMSLTIEERNTLIKAITDVEAIRSIQRN